MAAVTTPIVDVTASAHLPATVSVVVGARTLEHRSDLDRAMRCLEAQTRPPDQIVIVVDHNDDLLQSAADAYSQLGESPGPVRVEVVANTRGEGPAGTRNTGLSWSRGEVIAFLDDARAEDPHWLARILDAYSDQAVAGVGGSALADWDGIEQPSWFPAEFGWVVGCSYLGLPVDQTVVARLDGHNVSFRREIFDFVGGFDERSEAAASNGGAEADLCCRLRRRFPKATLVFDPSISVHRRVDGQARDFKEFRSACRRAGMTRAATSADARALARAGNDRRRNAMAKGLSRGLGEGFRGHLSGFSRAGAIVVGLAYVRAGYIRGRFSRLGR